MYLCNVGMYYIAVYIEAALVHVFYINVCIYIVMVGFLDSISSQASNYKRPSKVAYHYRR